MMCNWLLFCLAFGTSLTEARQGGLDPLAQGGLDPLAQGGLDPLVQGYEAGLANLAAAPDDEPYNYEIDYSNTDWEGISTPKCGLEIELMDVQKVSKPNQIRLSYTGDPTEMSLMWTTNGVSVGRDTWKELVVYGLVEGDLNYTAIAVYHQYTFPREAGMDPYKSGYIHEALLINLIPGRIHFYQIFSNGEESDVIQFVATPDHGSDTPLSFMHIGDVGIFGTSVMVTNDMIENTKKKQYHGVIHCGDISYANKYNASRPANAEQGVWDTWGKMVEPLGSKMPYMVVPGNHELDVYDSTNENNTIYTKRFTMPGNERYYSYGVGMVHFVAVSTDESIDPQSTQGVWLDRKLEYLNKHRDIWPWVVVFQHRPIYNSNKNHGNWSGTNNYTEIGYEMPVYEGWPHDYEATILRHNVDIVMSGHVHQYERTWPIRERNVFTKSYEDVKHPIYITCGHGGKNLYRYEWGTENDAFIPEAPFSAARDNVNWGHCEYEFIDRKTVRHLMYKMGSSEPDEEILITKSRASSLAISILFPLSIFIANIMMS